MTEVERFNEIQRVRATFANALAIGSILGGAFTAVRDQNYVLALVFFLVALVLHDGAVRSVRAMRLEKG